jgi:succinate-semialdehyde dehydrogenase / glutarate-semialdehyde dehydrogenase
VLPLADTTCSANRFFIQSGVLPQFIEKLIAKVSALKTGPGLDPSTTQGPLVNAAAVKKVKEHVADAIRKGGKIEYQGEHNSSAGFYHPPTIISGITKAMLVTYEETFGPLAPLYSFETEDEVVALANDTEFGLAGYLFSRNVNTVARVSKRLEVGMVGVNTGKISAPEAPFGGVKESGYGREGSLYGLDEYQIIKSVTTGNLDK